MTEVELGRPAEAEFTSEESSISEKRVCLVLRPQTGWAALDLCEVWRYRDLLLILAVRDIQLRYRQTALGVTWVILQPFLAAGVFTLVFGAIADLPSEGLPYFLFAYVGMIGWTAFQATLTKSSTSLVQSANLVSKVYFPRLVLPLATVISTALDLGVNLTLLLLLLPYWVTIGPQLLLVPAWFGLLLLMATGVGLLAAALMVPYRDVQHILPMLIQLCMYASPVAYGLAAVPERLRILILANPLTGPLEGLRWSLLGTTAPSAGGVAYGAAFAIAAFLAGAYAFKNMERSFADVI